MIRIDEGTFAWLLFAALAFATSVLWSLRSTRHTVERMEASLQALGFVLRGIEELVKQQRADAWAAKQRDNAMPEKKSSGDTINLPTVPIPSVPIRANDEQQIRQRLELSFAATLEGDVKTCQTKRGGCGAPAKDFAGRVTKKQYMGNGEQTRLRVERTYECACGMMWLLAFDVDEDTGVIWKRTPEPQMAEQRAAHDATIVAIPAPADGGSVLPVTSEPLSSSESGVGNDAVSDGGSDGGGADGGGGCGGGDGGGGGGE